MWIVYAAGSSFFAGITSILAKCGIKKTDSNVATAIRTVVVLVFSWLLVFLTDAWAGIGEISGRTMLFLVLSGLATGASWLCYFRALQTGDINKVVPIDKSSTVLTILLAFIFLHEGVTPAKLAAVFLIGAGTMLMISRKETEAGGSRSRGSWIIFAFLSAVFASLTGASWLCYYRALQDGAASVVVPIDKLSILVTMAFSWIVFHEKLSRKAGVGVVLITLGTVMLAVI